MSGLFFPVPLNVLSKGTVRTSTGKRISNLGTFACTSVVGSSGGSGIIGISIIFSRSQ